MNYELHRLNGFSTRNSKGTSAQVVRIFDRDSKSVFIGCSHPQNFQNRISIIR